MLSATDLRFVRNTVASFASDIAVVKRNTPTDDGQGGQLESWATIHTYRCWCLSQTKNGTENVVADSITGVGYLYANLPYGADVLLKDRLVINGVTYEVTDTNVGETQQISLLVQLSAIG